jgi:RNA polymerase sigma factor (sigma-70 family)
MHKTLSLNKLYSQYIEGSLDRKKIEGLIFQSVLGDLRRFNPYHWKREDCDDFVSWLYPRLSKAIDSYRDTGASFETFIAAIIRRSAREYRSRMADKKVTEHTTWTLRTTDLYTNQIEPEYAVHESLSEAEYPSPDDPPPRTNLQKTPRQILMLILKCYYYVSDDFLDRIAPMAGIEKEQLKKMIDKLRELRLKHDEELSSMKERIHCQFFRCIVYEKRLAAMPENSAAAFKMELRLQKARHRLAAMRKRLAEIRPGATNRQIAEVAGVSKGTVDASLHAVKTRWNNLYDKSILN